MEKPTAEERIRKAQEIYNRRKNQEINYNNTSFNKKGHKIFIFIVLAVLAYCYFSKNQVYEWIEKVRQY